jgi:hypothetical protein
MSIAHRPRIIVLDDDAPALGIVAHTRKPRAEERANGRALLNLLAGSYVIGSVPRMSETVRNPILRISQTV